MSYWRMFWDVETSGQAVSAGGTGRTTIQMQTAATFLAAQWDFVSETVNGTEDICGFWRDRIIRARGGKPQSHEMEPQINGDERG